MRHLLGTKPKLILSLHLVLNPRLLTVLYADLAAVNGAMLALHTACWPYQRSADNAMELLTLSALFLQAVVLTALPLPWGRSAVPGVAAQRCCGSCLSCCRLCRCFGPACRTGHVERACATPRLGFITMSKRPRKSWSALRALGTSSGSGVYVIVYMDESCIR